ncbi:AEC family transporter [Vibrio porteresiae]|uniref:AEC family transporter n=1 Tax=Vibrio porteresiae DSM 19223 TaxID=1123496 RepID=A0ABZ0QJP7_9VIBR|nr:AEC family transporter [Vibrio porteresiae]WPC76724.1 AEC family transporter [Vibrio porteresiae DSM 19223]
MPSFLDQLAFSVSITGPTCLMLALGVFFKRIELINENFIDVASKVVFQVTLPALLFLSIVQANHDFSNSMSFVIFGVVANIIFFLFSTFTTKKFFKNAADQGVIIQGGFRSNSAIVGLAYVANAYGNSGVALAAIYVAATTMLYNIQAVITLTPKGNNSGSQLFKVMLNTLRKNPLIISIVAGLIFYALSIPIPKVISDAGHYFANMTLPLALLCTGGSLDLKAMNKDKGPTWFSSMNKLIFAPIFITLGGVLCGFKGQELGIIFLMSSAPAAAASYVMARAMGGNYTLAANIIAVTTVFSLLTCTIGIFVLSSLNLF